MSDADAQAQRVERAIQGDYDVLEALLSEHGPGVRAQISGRIDATLQALLDPDDVMQVTYLEAFLRVRGLENRGPEAFRAWLATLATNNLRDAIRGLSAQKRMPLNHRLAVNGAGSEAVLLEQLAVTSTTASREFAVSELHSIVRAEVDALPTDYARVVRLYHLEGKSADEVASVLGRSSGSIYMLRARALDLLRERLMARLGGSSASA